MGTVGLSGYMKSIFEVSVDLIARVNRLHSRMAGVMVYVIIWNVNNQWTFLIAAKKCWTLVVT